MSRESWVDNGLIFGFVKNLPFPISFPNSHPLIGRESEIFSFPLYDVWLGGFGKEGEGRERNRKEKGTYFPCLDVRKNRKGKNQRCTIVNGAH